MSDTDVRIIDQTTDATLVDGDYVIVDSQNEGTRKYNLGKEIRDIKADLASLGGGVPTTVRTALANILKGIAYNSNDLDADKAVIEAWAGAVTALSVSPSTTSISGTGTQQLTATVVPSTAAVSWASSDTNVATVSNTGLVTSVGNGTCTITASAGDLTATCAVAVSGFTMYTITNTLTHVSNSNSATSIAGEESYTASLTADAGYILGAVTVTMGGTDITSTAYDNGSISIASVTGNVVITATATKDTTAQIATSGYVLEHTGTGTSAANYKQTAKTYGGITEKIQLDSPSTALALTGIIPYADSTITKGVGCLIIYDSEDTIVNHVDEKSNTSDNRWAQLATGTLTEYSQTWTVSSYSKIAFSVDVRYLDDAYMYYTNTGQVFFAGVNTPYYGMSNISEANS